MKDRTYLANRGYYRSCGGADHLANVPWIAAIVVCTLVFVQPTHANETSTPLPFAQGRYFLDVGYGHGKARGPVIAELFDPSLSLANAARLYVSQNKMKNVFASILFLNPPRPKARTETFYLRGEYALTGSIGIGLGLSQSGVWLENAPKEYLGIPLRDLGAFVPLTLGSCDGIVNPGSDCSPGLLDTLGIQERTRKFSNLNTIDFFGSYHFTQPLVDLYVRAGLGFGKFAGHQTVKGAASAGVRIGSGPYLTLEPFANYFYFTGKTQSKAERCIRESGIRIGLSFGFGN